MPCSLTAKLVAGLQMWCHQINLLSQVLYGEWEVHTSPHHPGMCPDSLFSFFLIFFFMNIETTNMHIMITAACPASPKDLRRWTES